MLFHFPVDEWLGLLCRCMSNAVWTVLSGHQCSSLFCAIGAATFYFSPLWCFHPFVAFSFALVITKLVLSATTSIPQGPRLPGTLMAGTTQRSPVVTKALQVKAKTGFNNCLAIALHHRTETSFYLPTTKGPFLLVHTRDRIPAWPSVNAQQDPPRQNIWLL